MAQIINYARNLTGDEAMLSNTITKRITNGGESVLGIHDWRDRRGRGTVPEPNATSSFQPDEGLRYANGKFQPRGILSNEHWWSHGMRNTRPVTCELRELFDANPPVQHHHFPRGADRGVLTQVLQYVISHPVNEDGAAWMTDDIPQLAEKLGLADRLLTPVPARTNPDAEAASRLARYGRATFPPQPANQSHSAVTAPTTLAPVAATPARTPVLTAPADPPSAARLERSSTAPPVVPPTLDTARSTPATSRLRRAASGEPEEAPPRKIRMSAARRAQFEAEFNETESQVEMDDSDSGLSRATEEYLT